MKEKSNLDKKVFDYLVMGNDMDCSYRSCTKEELREKILLLEATRRLIGVNNEVTERFVRSYEDFPLYLESFKRNLRETLESYRGVYFKRFTERLRLKSFQITNMMDEIRKEIEELAK